MRKIFTVLFVLLFVSAFSQATFAQLNNKSNTGYADIKAPPFVQPRDPGIVFVDNSANFKYQNSKVNQIIINQPGMSPNASATCYPSTGNYNTGSCNTTTKTQTSLMVCTSPSGASNAWAKFNVTSIPVGATITAVTLSIYVSANDCPYFYVNKVTADPVSATGATLYSQISGGTQFSSYSTCLTTGVYNTITLNATSYTDLASCLSQGWWAVGFYEYESSAYSFTADGQAETNKPYITVTYTPPAGTPLLTVSPTSLAFGYVPVGGTSVVKADTLRGTNLTGFPGNIVVTAPTGFEVCLTSGGTYTSSVNVAYSSATLAATTIYSRFKPTLLQNYTGNITNAGGGATTVNVAVTGSAYLYAGYCTSNASTTADEDIFNVTVGTLNNSSTCATTGGIGSILNEYSNYTTTVAAPNIQAGGSIPFSLTSGTCGGNYGNAFKIFIDYNQDGDFLDASEEAYVSPVSTSGPHTETGYISIPSGATLGNTMMRVIDVETSLPSGITSCGTYSWGETEDYVINITPPPANDVGPLSIDIPDVSYPGNITPQATVKNFGSATQTFNVTMVISPGAYTSTQTVTALASGLTQQVSFTNFTGAVGGYNVTVYTQLNPDANMTNDTMRKAINFSNGLWISGLAATTGTYLGTGVGYTKNDSGYVFSMGGNSTLGTEVIKYNVLANTYTTMTSLPAKRIVSSSALLKDSVYVIGGSTDGTNYLNTVVKYDINANTWTTLTSTLPVLIGWNKSAGYQDSLIYCAGGLVGGAPVSTVYLYNANTNSWRSATSMPAARFGGAMAISGDTIVYVGGADVSLLYATTYRGVISQTDRSVITWTTGTNYPGGPRYRFDAAPMGINKGIMVAGGSPSTAWTAVNDAYSYNPGLDKWTRRFNKTTAVLGGSVGSVYIGKNNWRYVVVSGYTGTGISTATELYADTILNPPNSITLLTPVNNATNQSFTNLSFAWTKALETVKGRSISNYWFEIAKDAGFTTGVIIDSLLTDTTKIMATLTSNTNYWWRVKAKNQLGWGAFSSVFTFKTAIDPTFLWQNNFTSVLIPQIMSCGGTTRMPVVIRATVSNLTPNKLYRFYNGGAAFTDLGTGGYGAGNPMFINPDSALYRYTSSVGLTTAGGYDQFRANGSGTYTGWFSFVNTANARFAAGKYIIPSIQIGDSLGTLISRFALNDSIKVVNFSTNASDTCGTGVYGISVAFPKNIVSLYDNVGGTGKPLSQTYLENEGVVVASIAPFYTTNVEGQNGRWGTVIPNINTNGVRRVEQRNMVTGVSMTFNTDADGIWPSGVNTVNPTGGLTALGLLLGDAPLLNYPVLVSPANNAINQPTSLKLDWNTVTFASSYRVQLSTDSLFTTIIKDSTLVPDSLQVTGLSGNTNYWWRVAGITTTGTAPFGTAFKFRTVNLAISLNLKVYLEGFWDGSTQVSDTTMVYLASATTPYAYVDTAKVVLSATGTASMNFNRVTTGSYYIVVNHRNHLETWSKLPQAFVGGTPLSYDFTTAMTQAFGDNMKQVGSVWVLIGGDANRDGSVDATDIGILVVEFGNLGYLSCDFNGDGDVNASDVLIISNNFGLIKITPGVEPLSPETLKTRKSEIENAVKTYNSSKDNKKKSK